MVSDCGIGTRESRCTCSSKGKSVPYHHAQHSCLLAAAIHISRAHASAAGLLGLSEDPCGE